MILMILQHLVPNMGLELGKQIEEVNVLTVRAKDIILTSVRNHPEDVAITWYSQFVLPSGQPFRLSTTLNWHDVTDCKVVVLP